MIKILTQRFFETLYRERHFFLLAVVAVSLVTILVAQLIGIFAMLDALGEAVTGIYKKILLENPKTP